MIDVPYSVITKGPDGKECVEWHTARMPKPPSIDHPPGVDGRELGNILKSYPDCPPTTTTTRPPSAQDARTPYDVAVDFWREIQLPSPHPSIAPGRAITGRPAYLETRGETTHAFADDTDLGHLEVRARGEYVVDWGDGTTSGPYAEEGGPWPDGHITHTYVDSGTYDVVVTERWRATWTLGDDHGDLEGLQTTGRIDDFRVDQVQAVVEG